MGFAETWLVLFGKNTPVAFNDIEAMIQQELMDREDPTISLHVDKSVPMEQVVNVMNIAKRNQYKIILATAAE